MKLSLPGLLKNAVRDLPREVRGQYECCFEELERHLRETIKGEHTLKEFADHYCLTDNPGATQ